MNGTKSDSVNMTLQLSMRLGVFSKCSTLFLLKNLVVILVSSSQLSDVLTVCDVPGMLTVCDVPGMLAVCDVPGMLAVTDFRALG